MDSCAHVPLPRIFGVPADITCDQEYVDKSLIWSEAGNLYYNAQIRTLLHEPRAMVQAGEKPYHRVTPCPSRFQYDAAVVGSGPNGLAAAINDCTGGTVRLCH